MRNKCTSKESLFGTFLIPLLKLRERYINENQIELLITYFKLNLIKTIIK